MKCLKCNNETTDNVASFWYRARYVKRPTLAQTRDSFASGQSGHTTAQTISIYEEPVKETVALCSSCLARHMQGTGRSCGCVLTLFLLVAVLFLFCVHAVWGYASVFKTWFYTLLVPAILACALYIRGRVIWWNASRKPVTLPATMGTSLVRFMIDMKKYDLVSSYKFKKPNPDPEFNPLDSSPKQSLDHATKLTQVAKGGNWRLDFWTEEEFQQLLQDKVPNDEWKSLTNMSVNQQDAP
jgi:hypothetical protein